MNVRRGVLAAVAAWLVVVVVGSTLAWAVISRAGEEVGDPSTAATGAAPTTADSSPTGRKTRTPDPTSTTDPTSPGSTAPPASTVRRTRTWQGLGGLVVVECEGKAASLVGAQADSGFIVEVNDRGPGRVEVEFEGQGDHEGEESRVRAFCVDGTPTFEVDSDAD